MEMCLYRVKENQLCLTDEASKKTSIFDMKYDAEDGILFTLQFPGKK